MTKFCNAFNIIHISIKSEHFVATTPEQHVSRLSVTSEWNILYKTSIYTKQLTASSSSC